ncbi:MAG: hypothetical protein EPN98_04255 [Phenylobacterium sp.]|uniref:Mom family adenine methylcarbamoylation protein n=1 Tax=Phenylobacterium sp. TaxID=1871053 RepID=UPI00120A6171|nr:hypothetical protein [Phenylobacterium sp.]TAL36823.1 MAG: hypothetical protein EPN98_04255 [Phenylobacterium sp.]
MQLDLPFVAQRWRERRQSYRPQREPLDPRRYGVVRLSGTAEARGFIVRHHYSGSYPVAIAAYGLMEARRNRSAELVGVAVFSVPVQPRAADAYGASGARSCDLGRFLLLDHVPGNAETWFLRRALAGLGQDKTGNDGRPLYSVCLAYSDPVPRVDRDGHVTFAGHYGGIYAASSALYLGRATARTLWLADDATVISSRALMKLKHGDSGARYAYETLRRHGAPPLAAGETGGAYIERALRDGPFRRLRHRGNHVYAFPCGSTTTRRAVRSRMGTALPYPVRTDAPRP